MILSKYIELLKATLAEHGDLNVYVQDDDGYFYEANNPKVITSVDKDDFLFKEDISEGKVVIVD